MMTLIILAPLIIVLIAVTPAVWNMIWVSNDPMQRSAVTLAIRMRQEERDKEKAIKDSIEDVRCAKIVRDAMK